MRLVIREKILFVEETHDQKKEEIKPKISYKFTYIHEVLANLGKRQGKTREVSLTLW